MSLDPRKVRPLDKWVVVAVDRRNKKTAGGIVLTDSVTNVEKVTEGSGTVLAVGKGTKNNAVKLEPGSRIIFRGFLKYANPIETDEEWAPGEKKEYFLLNIDDVLMEIAPDATVGTFS